MRRLARRRPATYKNPRLFTMCALLVCLFIMMNSLRSFREPGADAPRIQSNLEAPLNRVHQTVDEENGSQSATAESKAAEAASATDSQPSELTDGALTDSESNGDTASNVDAAGNLNLREDLFLQDQLGLIQDGALTLQKLEMPSYWRMMSVVKNASFEELQKSADSNVRFNELYSSAAKNRARLITMTVNIRRVTQYATEVNPAGVDELFEVWGWSETSKAWLYVFVTPELPPGLNANSPVNQTAKFAGYFYKLQGYHPGAAKPNSKPQIAPLLIGKFELTKPTARVDAIRATRLEWIAGAAIVLIGVVAIMLRMFVFKVKTPKVTRRAPPPNFGSFPEGFIETPVSGDNTK